MRYIAFMSYRRAEPDATIAERLHKFIETYRLPRGVRPGGSARLGRVFRDREELRAEPGLGEALRNALQESQHLLVLCSPESRASYWVQHEVDYFCSLGRASRVIPVLVAGEPKDVLPPAVLAASSGDSPLAVDLRSRECRRGSAAFHREALRLVARLADCGFDDLRQREFSRRVRRILISSVVAGAVLAAGGGVATMWAWERGERIAQERERARAELGRKKAALAVEIGVRLDEATMGDDIVFRATSNTQLETILGRLNEVAMWDTQRPEMITWCLDRARDLSLVRPEWAGCHATQAMLLYRLGRFDEAIRAAENAEGIYAVQQPGGEWPWPIGIRAMCLIRLGRTAEAQTWLEVLRPMAARYPKDRYGNGVLSQAELLLRSAPADTTGPGEPGN